jgi:hypothetical protein
VMQAAENHASHNLAVLGKGMFVVILQIMSPHYMIQPNGSVIVPRERWDAKPSPPLPRVPPKADDPSSSDK